jgi:hypothetical protein
LVILSSMLNFSFISFLGCVVRLMPAFLSSVTQREVASQAHPRVQSQGEGFTGVDGEYRAEEETGLIEKADRPEARLGYPHI